MDIQKIEDKIDRTVAGAVAISNDIGGVMFQNMAEVMEFSKLLAVAGNAVPKHLRGNPGGCLAVTIQALEWRMSPIAVANQSYEVGDKIAYMSQLIHAVVEARAPLKQRLRVRYDGDGGKRVCIISGHFKGELDPVEYRSPEFDKITPKNSPLWKTDPDQQQFYYSTRSWARRFCPDVIIGIYTDDELEGTGAENAKDITPNTGLKDRLNQNNKTRGFNAGNVDRALEHKTGETLPDSQAKGEPVAAEIIPPTERQLGLSAGDIETEVKNKIRAIENADTLEDLSDLRQSITDFLNSNGRKDLLGDVLKAVSDREKKIAKKAAKAAAE